MRIAVGGGPAEASQISFWQENLQVRKQRDADLRPVPPATPQINLPVHNDLPRQQERTVHPYRPDWSFADSTLPFPSVERRRPISYCRLLDVLGARLQFIVVPQSLLLLHLCRRNIVIVERQIVIGRN